MKQRIVLHIDFDYFYAQCEEIRTPDLKTKPVVVCMFSDRGGDSGAIATANYTAREFGVKSGLSILSAKQKLKNRTDSAFLPADFEYYSDMSEKSMNIIKKFADVFEYVGRDEAYLDVSEKVERDFTKASHIAQQIKNEVREKTKLTCSVGISPNKLLSKIASGYKKPDGLTTVTPDNISEFMETLNLSDIHGIGKKTQQKLAEENIETISEAKSLDIFDNSLLGDMPTEHVSLVFSLTSFLICCAIWLALVKSSSTFSDTSRYASSRPTYSKTSANFLIIFIDFSDMSE